MNAKKRSTEVARGISVGITHQHFDLASFIIDMQLANTWRHGNAPYAVHRDLHFSARMDLPAVFDNLALNLGWRAQRIDAVSIILAAEGLLISGTGTRKPSYCSCSFNIWAHEPGLADEARDAILGRIANALIRDPIISIDWGFMSGKGDLHSRHIEEIANDVLYDEAYPDLQGGVASFAASYLDAAETVLVLQGPPGTGKTRLIRGILGEVSRQKSGNARVLYTGDKRALETDEIFLKFLTWEYDAFVIEDADHILQPRAKGNDHLHRFLAIADGIVRAEGRKIIFSTNLPNVGDLDDALIRPGRCFARVHVRELLSAEAEAVLRVLCGRDSRALDDAWVQLGEPRRKTYSVASLYEAAARAKRRALTPLEQAAISSRPPQAESRMLKSVSCLPT